MKKIVVNITYKSVLTGIKNIEKRNEEFNSLDPQSQRLEIAWDALQLVLKRKVRASSGVYWSSTLKNIKSPSSLDFQKKLINELPRQEECQVCQRGLVMLSTIRLGNSIDSNDCNRQDGDSENIKGFNMSSMYNMEDEFEVNKFNHPYEDNTDEKLANICCNVLVNGDFNPEDKTNYLTVTIE